MRKNLSLPISILLALFGLSCEKPGSAPIDPFGLPPVLLAAEVSPSVVNTDTINVGPVRLPDDVLNIPFAVSVTVKAIEPGLTVRYAAFMDRESSPFASGLVRQSGGTAFSDTLTIPIVRSTFGRVWLHFWCETSGGALSSDFQIPVEIDRLNRPPVLSALVSPDTVWLSLADGKFGVTVQAADPDGASDILSVFRRTPSGKVFFLNDSGVNGDVSAGDGIYSEQVSVSPAPAPGPYLFQFQAVDRSGDSSNVIFHTIVIAP